MSGIQPSHVDVQHLEHVDLRVLARELDVDCFHSIRFAQDFSGAKLGIRYCWFEEQWCTAYVSRAMQYFSPLF